MSWNDLTYNEKLKLHSSVSTACATQNLEWLKKALPTAQDLVEYGDMNHGGGFLHTLMHSVDMKAGDPVLFLKKVMQAYSLENNPELKEKLFLTRNESGTLAANLAFIYPLLKDDEKKITSFEQGKINLYKAIAKYTLPLLPKQALPNPHQIAKEMKNAHGDSFPDGTPVAIYHTSHNPDTSLYWGQEQYPEIRLRCIGNKDKKIEERSCSITGLDPNNSLSLKKQIFKAVDFPEYFDINWSVVDIFEDDYKRLRKNDGQFAMYRYFNKLRGAVVIESRQEDIYNYAGYTISYNTQENGKKIAYPIIVIPSTSASGFYNPESNTWADSQERVLIHELFHQVDLFEEPHFSDMPVFKYAMMLTEQNKNNKIKDPFMMVNLCYNKELYNIEMAAQIMGVASPEIYKDSPLLSRVYKLGTYFVMAKADNNNKILNCLANAMENCPRRHSMKTNHIKFMMEKGSMPQYSENMNVEERTKIADTRRDLLKKQLTNVDVSQREYLEKHLIQAMDSAIIQIEKILQPKTPSYTKDNSETR